MTRPQRQQRGSGLSLTTLLLASLSSGIAAMIVSRFWEGGTVIGAAVTPVLVALFSEALRRPTERLSEAARPLADAARPRGGRRSPAAEEDVPRFGAEGPPPRVYGGRNVRLQAVLITAVLAFVIAAAALTLPELLLGRSVAGGEERTTYFGGSAQPRSGSESGEQGQDETDAETSTTTTTTTTTETAPTATEPGTPAPAPTEPAPPAGGEPAPPATTAPVPAPGQK